MLDLQMVERKVDPNIKECKGLYWRCRINTFISDKRICTKKELRFMKRKSCPGCEKCDWLWETLSELVTNACVDDYLADIEEGKLYTYNVETSRGYYDLYAEIDNINFIKVEE
ncbi:MAG: hypothetical protein DRJ03_01060 [Chloroflexi bacterium]|nr:MAG: hypothetical protein DRJ03_01060 [Chloroflexota bacterium]